MFDHYPSAIVPDMDSVLDTGLHTTTPIIVLSPKSVFELFGLEAKLSGIPPQLPNKVNIHELFLQELQGTMLERFSDDLKRRVDNLFGLNETEAFLEFLKLSVYYFSNNLSRIKFSHRQRIRHIFVGLDPALLRKIYSLKVPSVKAFLHALLLEAERAGDMAGGKSLLSADVDRNLYPDRPEKLLLAAVKFDHLELVRALLSDGCDVSYTSSQHRLFGIGAETPLCCARSTEMIHILCKAGADVNEMGFDGLNGVCPPISPAIRWRRIDFIRALLIEGASVSGLQREVLGNAIRWDNSKVIRILLNADATFEGPISQGAGESYCETELQFAAFSGSTNVLGLLLGRQPFMEELYTGESKWVALRDAVKQGHFAAAKLLLEAGANVNASSNAISVSEPCSAKWDQDVHLGCWDHRCISKVLPSTPLLAAVETKNIEMVKLLISYNANINQLGRGRFGSTALDSARYLKQWGICNLLVQSEEGDAGAAQMVSAAQQHDNEEIKRLLELGVNPACILDGDSNGHVDEPMLSIFFGVCRGNINATGPKTGRSPLQIALHLKKIYMAQELVQMGASLDPPGCKSQIPLCAAINSLTPFETGETLKAKVDLINSMVHQAVLSDNQKELVYTSLHTAIKMGVLEIVKILVEAGADIYTTRNRRRRRRRRMCHFEFALREALDADSHFQERLSIFEYLLLAHNQIKTLPGLEQDHWEMWSLPLMSIICRNRNAIYFTLLRLLMEHYPYGNAQAFICREWERVLQCAAESGDISTIRLLLKFGVDVNAPPHYNVHVSFATHRLTALQAAACCGHMNIALELIDSGAEINAAAANMGGCTALQSAAEHGHTEIALMLLERGADIEAPPARSYGITALQGAVGHGNIKLVLMLLERGADVNAPGSIEHGNTALEAAALFGRLDIAQLLLNAGAKSLETARDLAIEEGHFVMVDLLEDHIRKRDMDLGTNLE
jgi:ankyrin repeat protein